MASLSNCDLINSIPGPKVNGDPYYEDCTRHFTCVGGYLNPVYVEVDCPGKKECIPWTQEIIDVYECTIDEGNCVRTFTWIDKRQEKGKKCGGQYDLCDTDGENCCPGGTIPGFRE